MKYTVILLSLPLMISIASAEPINAALLADGQNPYVAETETHSTAGISNKAPPQYNREYTPVYSQQLPPDEMRPYSEEGLVNEELMPPTSVEQLSPTKSKSISRTTSRPPTQQPQPAGVDAAPVAVPVYPSAPGYPPPPGYYYPPSPLQR